MQRLVLWLRARFPDDSVGGFNPAPIPSSSSSSAKKASLRPQRRAPTAPATPIPVATSPAVLKKRSSTLSEDVAAVGEGSPKTRKTGKNTSPASTQRQVLSPVQAVK